MWNGSTHFPNKFSNSYFLLNSIISHAYKRLSNPEQSLHGNNPSQKRKSHDDQASHY